MDFRRRLFSRWSTWFFGIQDDINSLRTEMKEMKEEMNGMEQRLKEELNERMNEILQILKPEVWTKTVIYFKNNSKWYEITINRGVSRVNNLSSF